LKGAKKAGESNNSEECDYWSVILLEYVYSLERGENGRSNSVYCAIKNSAKKNSVFFFVLCDFGQCFITCKYTRWKGEKKRFQMLCSHYVFTF
jgi:hypothetical protein